MLNHRGRAYARAASCVTVGGQVVEIDCAIEAGRAAPRSENTIHAALERLGYSGEDQTGHGFGAWSARCSTSRGMRRASSSRSWDGRPCAYMRFEVPGAQTISVGLKNSRTTGSSNPKGE